MNRVYCYCYHCYSPPPHLPQRRQEKKETGKPHITKTKTNNNKSVLNENCFIAGSYFCYDNPAALQDQMLKDLNLTEGQFMLFYSLYSWPNVILCFFGGFLIDKLFGVRLGAIIFSGFVLVGQVCVQINCIYGIFVFV